MNKDRAVSICCTGAEDLQKQHPSEVLFLYRKKYGRMSIRGWLNAEVRQSSLALAVIVGCVCAVAFVVVQRACGQPYGVIMALGVADLLPPIWLLVALRFFSFAVIGCAAGLVLGWRERGCAEEKYRGGMFFLLLLFLELSWYPTLFVSARVFTAVLESVAVAALSLLVTVGFRRVSRLSGIVMAFHCVWTLYLMLLTFAVFFRN